AGGPRTPSNGQRDHPRAGRAAVGWPGLPRRSLSELDGVTSMFTGIIEEVGVVRRARPGLLEIDAALVLTDLHLGDSVAVDGACLTIVEQTNRSFAVNVQPETLRRTTLGEFRVVRRVNLERALAA